MFNSLFMQAAVYSGTALLVFGSLTWFFFFSPMKKRSLAAVTRPSARLINLLVAFLGAAMALMVTGALWDTSQHVVSGIVPGGKDFLWPPHIMLYGGFLLSFVVALLSIGFVAWQGWKAGERDPRSWVRANPALGAVSMASTYALMSIPGDALWHELFGLDLTAWSPPHVLIAIMNVIVSVSAVALWLQKPATSRGSSARDIVSMLLLGLGLNVIYLIGVIEWEVPRRPAIVAERPIWLYPLVGGTLALIFLLLAKRVTRFRWSATVTALVFYAARLGVSAVLSATLGFAPNIPLVFLLGAVLLDAIPWDIVRSAGWRMVAQAAAFTVGYVPVAALALSPRADLPRITGLDWLAAAILTLVLGLLFIPLANWAARRMVSTRAGI